MPTSSSMKAQDDEEEMPFFFGAKKKKKKKKRVNSNSETPDAIDKLAHMLAVDLVIETGGTAVRAESSTHSSSDDTSTSSSRSSSCSSRSHSSCDSTSSSGGSNGERRKETDGSKLLGTTPTQRCRYVTRVSSEIRTGQEGEYAAQVRSWADRVPIGLGLCPWAGTARSQGRLRYVTCDGDVPADVAQLILREAELLTRPDVAPLSTTLIVCPFVEAWKEFHVFDDWVNSGINQEVQGHSLSEAITLVSFHPEFLRWHGLPEGVEVGSVVQSHWGGTAGCKSLQTSPATLLETKSSIFGMHRLKVQFHDGRGEQFVPIDWFAHSVSGVRAPLPDNAMHRAPHPTVHLIRNEDLKNSVCMRDVSRVKRQNATRMMKLGWEGVERRLRVKDKEDVLKE